jgi:hypothetical protein
MFFAKNAFNNALPLIQRCSYLLFCLKNLRVLLMLKSNAGDKLDQRVNNQGAYILFTYGQDARKLSALCPYCVVAH